VSISLSGRLNIACHVSVIMFHWVDNQLFPDRIDCTLYYVQIQDSFSWKWLSSGMLRRVVSEIDVSELLTASIIRVPWWWRQ
jgi:hypothetical protein